MAKCSRGLQHAEDERNSGGFFKAERPAEDGIHPPRRNAPHTLVCRNEMPGLQHAEDERNADGVFEYGHHGGTPR